MSNRISLRAVEVKEIKTGDVSYGFIMSDDYAVGFNDNFTKEQVNIDDDVDLLQMVKENTEGDEAFEGLFDSMRESEKGLSINGAWYDYEEISSVFDN